ncbi:hypothetical protein SAMN05192558_101497 [Actinokineospora alba]|uniref:Uncharacterized protein n=1 Tax=Actinokineospora alba TaxID=504798 RepID=A0A1H0FT45_9PSEU|nr:hypothetical protein [Actinokineospora alba]TDP69602.1 hypothetical protein C8E96_5193 [Actinokineospora alba]SDI13219.1 hypothetical protein SAMN05421871_103374 [Actinokineospora alba]SDN97732.1 hypothetical protein SAMN05192558_101497 [Actinokineospora alba]
MRFKRTITAAVASAAALTLAMGLTQSASAAEGFVGRFTDLTDPSMNFELQLLSTHVPQGIAYWDGDGGAARFFVTHYEPSNPSNSRLAVHGADGTYFKNVRIGGGHVGGVVAWRHWLYTVDTDGDGEAHLRIYRLSDIGTTKNLEHLPLRGYWKMPDDSGAFVTISGDTLYFGTHTKDKTYQEHGRLYTWPMDPNTGDPASRPENSWGIPGNVQGLVVTENFFVFSQSWDRDCWSRITVRTRGEGFASDRFIYTHAMSEGIVNAAGTLYVNFESAADYYSGARNIVKQPRYGPLSTIIYDIRDHGRTLGNRSPNECDEE